MGIGVISKQHVVKIEGSVSPVNSVVTCKTYKKHLY